ncbi:MAG: response regulator transcription factor [Alphaproteobacteria bacterium]|nr:response regulator transcription factor [Alphaproteobacteria bacterium]
MNKVVLVVDDDEILRAGIAHGLRDAGFDVLTAPSAEFATEILGRVSVDAIVLDRMLGGLDGLSFLKQIRNSGTMTPTIMLTAMSGPENTIDGLMNGADDYLAKPFQMRELILRIGNIINRDKAYDKRMPPGLYITNDEFFVLDHNGTPNTIALSGEEKKLLQNLISPIGGIVHAQPMVAKRLRNKLNNVLSGIDIITVRGRGYKMICPTTDHNNNQGDKK